MSNLFKKIHDLPTVVALSTFLLLGAIFSVLIITVCVVIGLFFNIPFQAVLLGIIVGMPLVVVLKYFLFDKGRNNK